MKLNGFISVASLAALVSAGSVQASENPMSVGVGLSLTQGAGIEVGYSFTNTLSARGGYYGLNYDDSDSVDGIDYNLDLRLKNAGAFIDYHPFSNNNNGFRVTGGVLYNGNELDLSARPGASTYTIGSTTYNASDVGSLTGKVDFKEIAPYLSLAYDWAITDSVMLTAEGGVIFQGSPKVDLTANGAITSTPGFQQDLAQEEANAQSDLDEFKYMPVLKVSLSYRF